MEKPTVTAQAEAIEVVYANSDEPPYRYYTTHLNYNGGQFTTARSAQRAAKAIEKAIAKATETL